MKIIAGLGNPGAKYETTRHNIGFLAIDRLADRWNLGKAVLKNQAELFQGVWSGEKVSLLKPQTYMNRSGQSIVPLYQFYQCSPEDLIVIHDDLDLNPFTLRIKTGGGAGGHNGIKSIDEHLGKDQTNYHRVRIGIGHPSRTIGMPPELARLTPADYVLMRFSEDELTKIDPLLDQVVLAIEQIVKGDVQSAMNQFNRLK